MFNFGYFRSASGKLLSWKIECDDLTDSDLDCITTIVAPKLPMFQRVVGVPRGGVRLAQKLLPMAVPDLDLPTLIVDDVWTTGGSMRRFAMNNVKPNYNWIGLVIFAREQPDENVQTFFKFNL